MTGNPVDQSSVGNILNTISSATPLASGSFGSGSSKMVASVNPSGNPEKQSLTVTTGSNDICSQLSPFRTMPYYSLAAYQRQSISPPPPPSVIALAAASTSASNILEISPSTRNYTIVPERSQTPNPSSTNLRSLSKTSGGNMVPRGSSTLSNLSMTASHPHLHIQNIQQSSAPVPIPTTTPLSLSPSMPNIWSKIPGNTDDRTAFNQKVKKKPLSSTSLSGTTPGGSSSETCLLTTEDMIAESDLVRRPSTTDGSQHSHSDPEAEALLRLTASLHHWSFRSQKGTPTSSDEDELLADKDRQNRTSTSEIPISGNRKASASTNELIISTKDLPPSHSVTTAFSADLELVHRWFKESLEDDTQRLMTVFSLIQLLPERQKAFLVRLVDQNREAVSETTMPTSGPGNRRPSPANIQAAQSIASPIPSRPIPVTNNHNAGISSSVPYLAKTTSFNVNAPAFQYAPHSFSFPSISSSPSSLSSSPPSTAYTTDPSSLSNTSFHFSNPTLILDHVSLYFSDFAHWLRLMRLHKYQPCLAPYSKYDMLSWDEHKLCEVGIQAAGARSKFLRLFEQVRIYQKGIMSIGGGAGRRIYGSTDGGNKIPHQQSQTIHTHSLSGTTSQDTSITNTPDSTLPTSQNLSVIND